MLDSIKELADGCDFKHRETLRAYIGSSVFLPREWFRRIVTSLRKPERGLEWCCARSSSGPLHFASLARKHRRILSVRRI